MDATDADTLRFLRSLWLQWGQQFILQLVDLYGMSPSQREALEEIFLRPNDWQVEIAVPLSE